MNKPCLAPIIGGSSIFVCSFKSLIYLILMVFLVIVFILTFGSSKVLCKIRQLLFRIKHCRSGNSDPNIDLRFDPYERHVKAYREQYGKTAEWEQWMLDNRDRYEIAFNKAREKPEIFNISFHYDTDPIAYNPPWANETEHMTALEAHAEAAYPGYDFRFIFNGDTNTSYANVIAGIPTNNSRATDNIYLYYETIFNHEFGHVLAVFHHYDTIEEIGQGNHMPPGESTCLLDRTTSQYCSACRTALHLTLDVDNSILLRATVEEIKSRYPY